METSSTRSHIQVKFQTFIYEVNQIEIEKENGSFEIACEYY